MEGLVLYPPRETGLLRAGQLGDRRSEFDVENRVRHGDGQIDRGAIPFVERDLVCYRMTERSLFLVDPECPTPCGGVKQERHLRSWSSNERPVGLMVPIEVEWALPVMLSYG